MPSARVTLICGEVAIYIPRLSASQSAGQLLGVQSITVQSAKKWKDKREPLPFKEMHRVKRISHANTITI